MFKKVLIHARRSIKFIILFIIATFLITGVIAFLYKPTYSVYINGEQIGYTEDKGNLQHQINNYINHGDETNKNVAFVQVENLPEYKLCLLKKNVVTNDQEILNAIKKEGITYYRYYAISDNQEEKLYVKNFEEAENVVNELKEKDSSNVDNLAITEKYEAKMQDLTDQDKAVDELYVEKPKVEEVKVASTTPSSAASAGKTATKYEAQGTVNTALNTSNGKANLGISLVKPISGIITSRFGERSRLRVSTHTGLDISAQSGTPIGAVSAGTVTFAGYKGSYGNMVVISHGNGIQTYYGHCSKIFVSVGTQVSQGQQIAAVGSTGNSTGPHLHLEIRVNGVAYNPQNYLY